MNETEQLAREIRQGWRGFNSFCETVWKWCLKAFIAFLALLALMLIVGIMLS